MEACYLDSPVCAPTESFETSYLKKVCPYAPYRQRREKDDTEFVMIFNLKRQSSNAFFSDTVTSANETICPPQMGKLEEGKGGDCYYFLNMENDKSDDDNHRNRTAPILITVSDVFWLFSTGERAIYETAVGWNECLAKHFPQVLAKLAGPLLPKPQ
ncbi:hypothetical protein FACS189472_16800 [Alphaproteobacteria bacterium]|nr:hypothetical protein FACS189472_16800 [Alphaproteobacteria bacterium]